MGLLTMAGNRRIESECSKKQNKPVRHSRLVKVKFDVNQWHPLAHFIVMFDHPVNGLRNILKNKVKI